MNFRQFKYKSGLGFALLGLILILAISTACLIPTVMIPDTGGRQSPSNAPSGAQDNQTLPSSQVVATQQSIPTLAAPVQGVQNQNAAQGPADTTAPSSDVLVRLHNQVSSGVVNIKIYINQGGETGRGAGSGFVIDNQGHIVTNNHVVAGAGQITVVFANSIEEDAQVVGTDPNSDLAVIKVANLPEGVQPLPLGDSDKVQVGEWVIAIGNPFGLGGSMSVGIISATGRTIESGATPFSIPQALQTDAAINPGNSGGPLMNLSGHVIGVNAQIATNGGAAANAGVGFAIPSNVVRRVAPVLIQTGTFQWPYLGVQGGPVNLTIMQANNLPTQQGAYIDSVIPGGPADKAGLQGSSGTTQVNGFEVPVGGDVIIEADGAKVPDFNSLLVDISQKNPGDQLTLTILRDGKNIPVTVTLGARPQNTNDNISP